MKIIQIVREDFVNYKKPCMFIITCKCSFKCDKEAGTTVCQNSKLAKSETMELDDDKIVKLYLDSDLTEAIVFGGLEPLDQFDEVLALIKKFRSQTRDPIIIYTGYNEEEVTDKIQELRKCKNIIVKFGRFIPNRQHVFDKLLGVELASDNQYSKRI